MLAWQEVDRIPWYFEGRCKQNMLYSQSLMNEVTSTKPPPPLP